MDNAARPARANVISARIGRCGYFAARTLRARQALAARGHATMIPTTKIPVAKVAAAVL